MVRKKVVCFKEGKQLLGDNGLHSLRDERSDCNRAIVGRHRFVTFLGIGKREQVSKKKRSQNIRDMRQKSFEESPSQLCYSGKLLRRGRSILEGDKVTL